MNQNDKKFTKLKKLMAIVSGGGVLYASIIFSKNGFNFETNSAYSWIGILLALAATSSEFMVTSEFKKLNWSVLLLGLAGYAYSIWTNMVGFQQLRGNNSADFLSVSASIFMDVYPEVAISWALGESKLGDLLGNIVQSVAEPEKVTEQVERPTPVYVKSSYKPKHKPAHLGMSSKSDLPDFLKSEEHNEFS